MTINELVIVRLMIHLNAVEQMRMLQTISDPVAQCGGTTSTFPADGTTVSYQMTTGTTAICLWMAADLSAIDINYNANTQSVSLCK